MKRYNYFSSRFCSGNNVENKKWIDKVINKLGRNGTFSLYGIEEKLYAAALCYSKLKLRQNNFKKISKVKDYFGGVIVKTNHAYEYFFFTCCGYLYRELTHLSVKAKSQKWNHLIDRLKKLKEERRVQEHGKEWLWGEEKKNNPPCPSEGDNYNFKLNMDLLDQIYNELKKLI